MNKQGLYPIEDILTASFEFIIMVSMGQPSPADSHQQKYQRKNFLINKSLQFRYLFYIGGTLLIVSGVIVANLYFGIWGGVFEAFSDKRVQDDLLMASRLTQYEEARTAGTIPSNEALGFFKQAQKLSQRQREIFKEVLDTTNRKLISKSVLLIVLIAWGTIYITHKIAGPLYRFNALLKEMQQGNFRTRVHLRQFDEAQFLADDFNETLDNLDTTFAKIKNIVRENQDNPQRLISRLNDELSKIKTSADH